MNGLAFVPLERLPIYVWAIVLIALGGFLLLQEDLFSWPQARGGLILVVGICALVYDVRKRINKRRNNIDRSDEVV